MARRVGAPATGGLIACVLQPFVPGTPSRRLRYCTSVDVPRTSPNAPVAGNATPFPSSAANVFELSGLTSAPAFVGGETSSYPRCSGRPAHAPGTHAANPAIASSPLAASAQA